MHKKTTAIIVTASALAFFLLAFCPAYAGTTGPDLKAVAQAVQQALQKAGAKPEQTKPQPSPSPVQTKSGPAPAPAAKPSKSAPPKAEPHKPQPRLFHPEAPKPEPMPKPAKTQPVPPPKPRQQTAHAPAPSVHTRGEVSFNFDDADVYSVIQTVFGDVLRVNYVIDPAVKGRVTFRSVEPVAKKDVLPLMEVILRLNGIGIVQEGTLYRIIPIGDISKEPAPVEIGRDPSKVKVTGKALVQIVPIKYMKSSDMVKILTPFLSKNAVIVDIPSSNYVVIVDTDSNVKRMLRMVSLFDNPELQSVTPRVYVYAVQNGKAKDVANLLQQIFLGSKPSAKKVTPPETHGRKIIPGKRPVARQEPQVFTSGGGTSAVVSSDTKIIPDEVTNSLIILATPEDYVKIKDAISKIDIPPRQVMIEAMIVQVDLKNNLSFGLSWSLNTDLKLHPFKRDVNLSGDVYGNPGGLAKVSPGTSSAVNANGFTFVGTDPTGTVRAVLSALEGNSNATVIAAPHVLVSDNKEASIQIGSQVPIPTSTTTPIAGTTTTDTTTSSILQTQTIQYEDVGIILKVKPQVNDSGLINLEFSQEISSVSTTGVTIGGQSEPVIEKTEAKSNLVAQDGETIVIGGLIRQDKNDSQAGIPLLSKIPIIGALFGSTTKSHERKELIILLTPHVVRNQKEARGMSSEYIKRYKGVTEGTENKQIDQFIEMPNQSQSGQKKSLAPKRGVQKNRNIQDQEIAPSPAVSP